ncbi:TolC family protein [Azohydromonas aeria]|uniref:TolC family protein n=1 Tax=Azohydromonas aeria TaxID=2590212 RepID=UPI0012FBE4F2|nr:TolC family protein [Azohydromonas aeria]
MKNHRSLLLAAGAAATVLLTTGCAQLQPPVPQPLQAAEIESQLQLDRAAVRRDVAPLGATLTLDEAVARALKYNLDRRARLMEQALAAQQFDASRYDMLPKLLASAGYSMRDSDRISRSTKLDGTPVSTDPLLSQDRQHLTSQLDLSWSILDFSLARYASEQAADRVLAAAERRRKATHQLVQDVRVAFWRVASAQRLNADVRASLKLAEEALADARQAEVERLRSPLESLRYQRQLTENMRLLESIEHELATARFELAALINAPVMLDTRLAVDDEQPVGDPLAMPAEAMEELALAQNADLREQVYQRRIAATEARRVIARAYPNVSFNLGPRYDTDKYLVHNGWAEAGVQVSWNVFNLLALPSQKRAAEAGVALADQRRLAAHVATVAQVHVAREQLLGARRQFERADVLWQLDDKITRQLARREQAAAGSKLERVAAQTTTIVSLLRRYQALAQVHAAQSRLQATLGVDPLPHSSDDLSLEQIAAEVRAQLSARPAPAAAAQ